MRRCYLHIGMHKTGSTAIQTALDGFDDGKTACLQLSTRNHSVEMFMAFSERRGTILTQGLSGADRPEELAASILSRIEVQLKAHRKNVIISGEEMSAQFGAAEIAVLRDFLKPHFEELRVIVYVREPFSMMGSSLQEMVKHGLATFDMAFAYPYYRVKLEPWFEAFGAGMEFVAYNPPAFPGGSVIADFARRTGIALPGAEALRTNESLSAEACALCLHYNRQWKQGDLSFGERLRLMIAVAAASKYGSTPFALDHAACAGIVPGMEDDLAWVEARLGRPLPVASPVRGAVIFGSEADVLAYAANVLPQFERGLQESVTLRQRASALNRLLRRRGLR